MDITATRRTIELELISYLERQLPFEDIKKVYQYAVLPPGKLFRPLLAYSLFHDLSNEKLLESLKPKDNLFKLCSFLEMHHAYTLIHDDLPCMDDDKIRRNKPTTHIAFSEWQALLAGDGLLNASYNILSQIESNNSTFLIKFASWCLGPKGLIQGQVLDLSQEIKSSFETLKRTHLLKTARLIQLSLVGALLILPERKFKQFSNYRLGMDFHRLGKNIGLIFQFIDDLTELTDQDLSKHEQEINPWLKWPSQAQEELIKNQENMSKTISKYQLFNLEKILKEYFEMMLTKLQNGQENIILNLEKFSISKEVLAPIMVFLKRLSD